VRNLVEETLRAQGYTVLVAANGADALKLADEYAERLDVLVTDVVMPGMSGAALADTLRARYRDLRIVFVSGYTPAGLLRSARLDNDVAYFQKPFSLASLAAKVREMLNTGREGGTEVG